MKYILEISAVFALVWLPASGCCQPPPQTPTHHFGGHSSPPAPSHYPQTPSGNVRQHPGATGMPPAQVPNQHQFQPPAAQHSPAGEVEQVAPGSGPMQGR